jgi:hypothetical protein
MVSTFKNRADQKDETHGMSRNVGNRLPTYAGQHPRRAKAFSLIVFTLSYKHNLANNTGGGGGAKMNMGVRAVILQWS